MATPWSLIDAFAGRQTQAASQERNNATQMLLNVFQEEAARQRPYATMPAELAQAELNRRNAEPYEIRGEQRRYQNSLALAKAKAALKEEEETSTEGTFDENGNEIIVVNGKKYVVPPSGK